MPIPFTCECGKSMTAKDEFAGRRLRCPECQRVVAIPGTGAAARKGPTSGTTIVPPAAQTRKPKIANPATFRDTQPLSNTLAVPNSDQFAKPVAKPMPAVPLAKPIPVAATLVAPIARPITAPVKPGHSWLDLSLTQTETPWRVSDEARYQGNVTPAREWEFPYVPVASIVAAIGFFVLAIAAS